LRPARLIGVGRPEPAGVRCEDLVYEDHLAVGDPELELRVGDDHATRCGENARPPVDVERVLACLLKVLRPRDLGGLLFGDVLVVPARGLGRGGQDRLVQAVALAKVRGQLVS
jgi:hypothetical protein